jgi:hypothetical protein
MLSEYDPEFDFFMCGDCDHAWKEPKTAPATPHFSEQPADDTP